MIEKNPIKLDLHIEEPLKIIARRVQTDKENIENRPCMICGAQDAETDGMLMDSPYEPRIMFFPEIELCTKCWGTIPYETNKAYLELLQGGRITEPVAIKR
jgi:hypothetical protein